MAIDDKEIENLERRIRSLSSEITKEAKAKKTGSIILRILNYLLYL